MNFERIRSSIDVERMQNSHIVVVGGAYGLAKDLVRCGAGAVTYIDFDQVDSSNPARQDFNAVDLGQYKTEVLVRELRQINPDVQAQHLIRDFCELGQDELEQLLAHADLLICATGFHPAQARGNQVALRMGRPAIWIGLYRGGRAGEIVYYVPGVTPACYRCICESRYRLFEAAAGGRIPRAGSVHIPSVGSTILDLRLVDAIAGQVAVGILTRGAENRMGRLIDQLGNRNLLQIKIDPDYRLGDKDIFGQHLGHDPANFSFTTLALSMEADEHCPDCAPLRVRKGAAA